MSEADLWIIATATAASVSCGVLGCFLILRRMALLGDAITHSILPGLAASFLLAGTRSVGAMLLGALISGILTAFLSAKLTRMGKVPEDAALGVVFSSLFALGVVMISAGARNVDLDPGCVLYGLIEFTPFDTTIVGGLEVPRAFLWLSAVLVVNVALIGIFFKELKLVSFDENLAISMGINASLIHYGFLGAVSATAVASFESVGSILVVSMLVTPGATAHLFTDRLSFMLLLSAFFATLSAVLGYFFALHWNTSVAGMMSAVGGGVFLLASVFAPRYGSLSRRLHQAALSIKIVSEDILGLLYRCQEERGEREIPSDHLQASGSPLLSWIALAQLRARGAVTRGRGGVVSLTPLGSEQAKGVIRSHRLWESFLAKHLALPLDHLHAPSERMEHFLPPDVLRELESEFGEEPDPHGKKIPD